MRPSKINADYSLATQLVGAWHLPFHFRDSIDTGADVATTTTTPRFHFTIANNSIVVCERL